MRYIIELSTKRQIEIDEEDFEKFHSLAGTGNFIKLKRGIVNPSFVVDVVPVKGSESERVIEGYLDEKKNVFVVTKEKKESSKLEDAFANTRKGGLPYPENSS